MHKEPKNNERRLKDLEIEEKNTPLQSPKRKRSILQEANKQAGKHLHVYWFARTRAIRRHATRKTKLSATTNTNTNTRTDGTVLLLAVAVLAGARQKATAKSQGAVVVGFLHPPFSLPPSLPPFS